MPRTRLVALRFPSAGVNRRFAYAAQPPYSAFDALNVWPSEVGTGRERGGTRAGLTSTGASAGGTPHSWCRASWVESGTTYDGIAVASSGGVRVLTDAGTASERITTNPGSGDSSVAVFMERLFVADRGSETRSIDLTGGSSGAGATLSSESSDSPPTDCGLVVAHLDRLILADSAADPHNLYCSRVADYTDWDYTKADAGGAFALSTGSAAGKGGFNFRPSALIPHSRDCLLIGSPTALTVMRGNPRAGGSFEILSSNLGPLSQTAWCKTGNDYTMLMTRDGLYSMQPGCGDAIVSVSREHLPRDLVGLSTADRVVMGYDSRWRGIHIYVDRSSGSDVHWFYDLSHPQGGFWPMDFGTRKLYLAADFAGSGDQDKSDMIAISSGGTCYQFNAKSTEVVNTYLEYGPIRLGDPGNEGLLLNIGAALSDVGGDVNWSIRTGTSPQEASEAIPSYDSRSDGAAWVDDGWNDWQSPNLSGVACYLRVDSRAKWSIEELVLEIQESGLRRTY